MQRPWNKVPEVVYSLSTISKEGKNNMNICTYVVPISMKPKKYMIALDPNSKTYDNFCKDGTWILQILSKSCKKYVNPLWKKSGKNINKLEKYRKETITYKWFPVLNSVVAVLQVKLEKQISVVDSDHDLFIVDILHWKYINSDEDFLYTSDIFN